MEATSLDIVTLVIAVLALSASVGALVWAMVAWRLTGSWVKVKATWSFNPDTRIEVIGIRARNVGRTPVSVIRWGFKLPDKRHIPGGMYQELWSGPRIPYRLEPGHSEGWRMPLDDIRKILASEGLEGIKLRPYIELGTGKEAVAEAVEI